MYIVHWLVYFLANVIFIFCAKTYVLTSLPGVFVEFGHKMY